MGKGAKGTGGVTLSLLWLGPWELKAHAGSLLRAVLGSRPGIVQSFLSWSCLQRGTEDGRASGQDPRLEAGYSATLGWVSRGAA